MSANQIAELLAAVSDAVANGREHFKSNGAHAKFAGELAEAIRWMQPYGDDGFDSAAHVMECMPPAWIGSNKANPWEAVARAVMNPWEGHLA